MDTRSRSAGRRKIRNEESSMKFRTLLTAAILLTPLNAWAIANPQAGEEIALQSCTMCHAPMATQGAKSAALSFSALAEQNKAKPGWTQAWMSNPHMARAGVKLSKDQADDVVAYLRLIPNG
jgi:mono/diheme cytochrome c family protein